MMKTKRLCQAVYLLFCLIQIALLGAVYILQTLTTKKSGVNHHLRFTRTYWMHNYLTPQNTLIFSIILVLIAAVIFVALFRLWNKTGIYSKIAFILSLLWIAALLLSLHLEIVSALLVYPYLLLAETIALLLSCINIVLGYTAHKQNR